MTQGGPDNPIPVIDIFAGPGGLGEGFSCFPRGGKKRFRIRLSIEKDADAHRTLTLRAFFRQFEEGHAPADYYNYLKGTIKWEELEERHPEEMAAAKDEARNITLGNEEIEDEVFGLIRERTEESPYWVLVGGPPCQVYSLAGRSRRLGVVQRDDEADGAFQQRRQKAITEFEEDDRQKLYEEYRKILADHWPSVFVMENVKGMLSARDKVDGERIFPKVLEELRDPGFAVNGITGQHTYRVYSFSTASEDLIGADLKPRDYVIRAENYGVPQARHRVILLGIRDDLPVTDVPVLTPSRTACVSDVIDDLPRLDSTISGQPGVDVRSYISNFESRAWFRELCLDEEMRDVVNQLRKAAKKIRSGIQRGGRFLHNDYELTEPRWREWFHDSNLDGVCNHLSRRHKDTDLDRYFFSSCYTLARGVSPRLSDYPILLLPEHRNAKGKNGEKPPHNDRFRTQCSDQPATTVTCHIRKDGHYNIHPDPSQVRSLTVREAARLQTFPDNYFFEGGQTSQFKQVGNAVPPFLAHQLADIVWQVLSTAISAGSD